MTNTIRLATVVYKATRVQKNRTKYMYSSEKRGGGGGVVKKILKNVKPSL
jgi:hypothetical protein